MQYDKKWAEMGNCKLITTEILGKAVTPDLPYEQTDGRPYIIDRDYLGNIRDTTDPFPGPFETQEDGEARIKVWPVNK